MKKYVAYYRVSTTKQGRSGLGLRSQKDIIEHYSKIDGELIKSFTDIASGKSFERRDNLKKAVEYVMQNKNYYLIVAKADRLSRDVDDARAIYRDVGKRLICCDIPNLDTFTFTLFYAVA